MIGREVWGKRIVGFEPTHTLFMLTNNKPHIHADDYAIWKRIFLIPFKLSYVDKPVLPHERQKDPDMRERLKDESSGILAWLVRGCLEWQRQGLEAPQTVEAATEEYRKEEDIIGQFIEERCTIEPGATVKSGELYGAYTKWAHANEIKPVTQVKFSKKMAQTFEKHRDNSGVFYKGIGFRERETVYTDPGRLEKSFSFDPDSFARTDYCVGFASISASPKNR